MSSFSRRAFLGTLAAALPASALVRRAHALAVDDLVASPRTMYALTEAVLPSELSEARLRAVTAGFQRWIGGYRENAEMLHGYGTSALERTRPSPATRWAAQLDALDASAQRLHRKSFAELSVPVRQQMVQRQLDALKMDRIPPIASAPHVALALLAHFYGSAEATDLCYQAAIGKQQCRPLATSSRKPLPLA